MIMRDMDSRYAIRAVSDSYLRLKRVLKEDEIGLVRRPRDIVLTADKIVSRTELIVDSLPEQDRFIIYNEVILGKKGDWYRDYLSPATYYRHRKGAYDRFIRCLNQ